MSCEACWAPSFALLGASHGVKRDAGASLAASPRRSVGTITVNLLRDCYILLNIPHHNNFIEIL
jgi:hypothetical protein